MVKEIFLVISENFLYEFVFKYLRIYNVNLFLLLRFLKKNFYININWDFLYNFNGFGIYSLFNYLKKMFL